MRFANTGDRTSALRGRADEDVPRDQRPRLRDHRGRPTTGRAGAQVGDTVVRVVSRPGFPAARDARRRRERALRKLEARLGPYPYRVLKVVQSAGALRHGGARRRLDPDRDAVGQPAIPGHPRDRPPVVLRDRRQRPGPRAVRRRGRRRLRRPPGPRPPPRLPLRDGRPRPLDLRLLVDLLLRGRLHPGRQPARQRAPEDGLGGVLGGAPRLRRRPAMGPDATRGPCSTPSTRDAARTCASWWRHRFPTLY